jgi:hypothetical protein
MHTTVSKESVFDAVHPLGACSSCGTQLKVRTGEVYAAQGLHRLYCDTCKTACAETPDDSDLRELRSLLMRNKRLAVGNVGGLPDTLRRLMAREPRV